MVKPTIKETKEYGMFKFKKGNRVPGIGHIDRLVKSIKNNNLLPANPIIVNKKMEIIDGQHRLQAAKALKISIYYVEFDPASLTEIQMLNSTVKQWTAIDFMKSYIIMGKEDYKFFQDFWEKYNFPFNTILVILASPELIHKKHINRDFKEGLFKINHLKKSIEMADRIQDIIEKNRFKVRFNSYFYKAILNLMNRYPSHLNTLEMRLAEGAMIYRADNTRNYYRQFEDIINKGVFGKPIRLF